MNGSRVKKINALISVAFLTPAIVLGFLFPASPALWVVSFALGILWANFFEYLYHKLDHTPGTYLERLHRAHHVNPSDPDTVNLGANGLVTLGMFLVNGVPMTLASLWLHIPFAAPVWLAFVIYVLVTEEVHWRVHMGGWVPASIKKYHLSHHGKGLHPTGGNTKFNIFLPIFDWLFGTN